MQQQKTLGMVVDAVEKGQCGANEPLSDGTLPLCRASLLVSDDFARRLLSAGADPTLRDSTGLTALHVAASFGPAATLRALLDAPQIRENPATVDVSDGCGRSPLFCAALHRRDECRSLLCARGADRSAAVAGAATSTERFSSTQAQDIVVASIVAERCCGGDGQQSMRIGDLCEAYAARTGERLLCLHPLCTHIALSVPQLTVCRPAPPSAASDAVASAVFQVLSLCAEGLSYDDADGCFQALTGAPLPVAREFFGDYVRQVLFGSVIPAWQFGVPRFSLAHICFTRLPVGDGAQNDGALLFPPALPAPPSLEKDLGDLLQGQSLGLFLHFVFLRLAVSPIQLVQFIARTPCFVIRGKKVFFARDHPRLAMPKLLKITVRVKNRASLVLAHAVLSHLPEGLTVSELRALVEPIKKSKKQDEVQFLKKAFGVVQNDEQLVVPEAHPLRTPAETQTDILIEAAMGLRKVNLATIEPLLVAGSKSPVCIGPLLSNSEFLASHCLSIKKGFATLLTPITRTSQWH